MDDIDDDAHDDDAETHEIIVSLCAEFNFDSHDIHRYALGSFLVLAGFFGFIWVYFGFSEFFLVFWG